MTNHTNAKQRRVWDKMSASSGSSFRRLLLLDHIGSSWPPIYAAQWLLERITIRTAGEHFTRRQLSLVKAAGLEIVETQRLKAGSVERIHARKPAVRSS